MVRETAKTSHRDVHSRSCFSASKRTDPLVADVGREPVHTQHIPVHRRRQWMGVHPWPRRVYDGENRSLDSRHDEAHQIPQTAGRTFTGVDFWGLRQCRVRERRKVRHRNKSAAARYCLGMFWIPPPDWPRRVRRQTHSCAPTAAISAELPIRKSRFCGPPFHCTLCVSPATKLHGQGTE